MTTNQLDSTYKYLKKEPSPRILLEGLKLYGVKEITGKQHNKEILDWAKELNISKIYTEDEIPWCGLFVAICAKRAGYAPVVNPLWARNWSQFGVKQTKAMLGDILVFSRGNSGHVGIYVGEDGVCYHVLGGNQSNMVNITRIEKSRCISINRCNWQIGQPFNIRPIYLTAKGEISSNEA
jgi:uncharacterized protein (TIGR02594 family)